MTLTTERVHLIRVSGKADAHFARLFCMTTGSIRDARVGRTWLAHPTKPDDTPRGPGRPFKRLHPATDIDAALGAWRSDPPENT